jgi:hypothetical protein
MLLLVVSILVPLHAQDSRGRITGQILDPSGTPAPRCIVEVIEAATGVKMNATSNETGIYELPYLVPGIYSLTVSAPGFKTYTRTGIEVRVDDHLVIDVTLALGQVAETITVAEQVSLVDSSTASLGQVTDTRRLTDLPLSAGNTLVAAEFAPGVTYLAQPNHPSLGIGAVEVVSNMSVNGTPNGNTQYTIDGTPSMTGSMPSYSPPTEMVAEVKVQTASYDASAARVPGGNVNIVLRSGANRLHGAAWWFHTDQHLEGLTLFQRQYLYNPATGPVTDAKALFVNPLSILNRYGASLNGPVVLPKLYDGHNRTFWSWGFEGLSRPIMTLGSPVTVPTAAERTGDFSALLQAGSNYQIYDPATIAAAGNGRFSRQPFAGNIIPASRLDRTALNLLKYWPNPNQPGLADGTNNYVPNTSQTNRQKNLVAKVDHNFSDRNRTSLRYNYGSQDYIANPLVGTQTNVPDRWRHSHGAGVDDVFVFSPTLLNDARIGFTRYDQSNTPILAGFDLTSIGFSKALNDVIDPRARQFPTLNVSGYQSLGGAANNDALTNYTTFTDEVTWSKGAVIFRFGGEYRLMQSNSYAIGGENPTESFASTYTNGPLDNSAASPLGQGLASFLLGIPTGGSINMTDSYADQSYNYAFYFQSDWRVTRKLTLNMGVRYDYDSPITERYNRSVGAFNFTSPSPIASQVKANYASNPIPQVPVSQFAVNGGLTFAGDNGQSRGLWATPHLNFAPRFGLAYELTPETVIRTGYGIFYVPQGVDRNAVSQSGFAASTTLTPSSDNGQHFIATMANPFPNGLNQPLGSSGGLSTGLGNSVSAFPASLKSAYSQRWSFGIQRQLPKRIFLDVSYVGTRSVRLPVARQFDGVPGSYYSTLPVRDTQTINLLTAAVSNPFYPLLPGTGISGTTVQRQQLLRPYPQFTGLTILQPVGYSWYHAMQLLAEKRMSHGFTAQFNWTWSKYMDASSFRNDFDPTPEKVISSVDHTHVLHLSGIYELPFGRGKLFLSHSHGVTRVLTEGWQLQTTWQFFTGAPIGFGNALLTGTLQDIVSGPQTIAQWFNVNAFDRKSADALSWNVQTLSTRFSGIRGPGVDIWNISAIKTFNLRENLHLQFRAEALNALNHTCLSNPSTNPTATDFGSITAASSQPRFIHLALKLSF